MNGKTFFRPRAADSLNVFFLSFLLAVSVFFRKRIDGVESLVAEYGTLIALQFFVLFMREKGDFFKLLYDLIFPTACIVAVFDSLGRLVHSINPHDIDPLLVRLDYLIFGFYPTVMLEKIMNPFLTDVFQLAYSSYYFLPVALGVALKMKKDEQALDRAIFFVMLCFYLSYMGYMIWPAVGPRFTIYHLQSVELRGFLFAQPVQEVLNRLEGVKRDAFPSGHTGVALTVLYLARRYERRLFAVFLPVVLMLIFSTVYCRYHYVVDVIAGVVLAAVTIALAELYYAFASDGGSRFQKALKGDYNKE